MTNNTQRLGSLWKGRAWDDGEVIPRLALPDATLAEAMAALGYGWNATASAFQRMAIDNATGGLNVNIAGGGVSLSKAGTSTVTQVASSATNVTLLASNTNRLGATIYNDSTQAVFVKFGTTASSSSYTIKMAAASYYEVPFSYTGRIDGIWVSANGNAYVTELTA